MNTELLYRAKAPPSRLAEENASRGRRRPKNEGNAWLDADRLLSCCRHSNTRDKGLTLWWRINAWSEIAAMESSFIIAVGFFVTGKMSISIAPHVSLVITVAATTLVWIVVTPLTSPTDRAKFDRVLPTSSTGGLGWRQIRAESGTSGSSIAWESSSSAGRWVAHSCMRRSLERAGFFTVGHRKASSGR